MTLPVWLKQADIALMELINRRWSNGIFDTLLPWVRNQITWYPMYLFLVVLVLVNFGKKGLYWILGFICTIAIADLVSSRLLKYNFERIRPCRDPEVMNLITLRIPNCSGGYSFTSSHAANHFAMATFIFLTLHAFVGKKLAWIFFMGRPGCLRTGIRRGALSNGHYRWCAGGHHCWQYYWPPVQ
jgi:PAP2 superfamily